MEARQEESVLRPAARIVVVDDDAQVRLFMSELLGDLGHDVAVFEDGQSAIAAAGEDAPDLALIDFAMPGMNGAQLAEALRSRHPDLPIAFVTGYAESDQIETAVGADVPVLRKPFGVEALSALVAELLRRDEGGPGLP